MKKTKEYVFSLTARRIAPVISLVLFAFAVLTIGILQHQYYNNTYSEQDLQRFTETLKSKEAALNDLFVGLSDDFAEGDPLMLLNEESDRLKRLAEQQDMYIFYYENGRLRYWTDHSVPLGKRLTSKLMSPVIQTMSATYVALHQPVENGMLLGLILVRTEYPYENDYLEDGYQKDFKLDAAVELFSQPGPGLSDITNQHGEYLFSIDLKTRLKGNELNVTISLFMFML